MRRTVVGVAILALAAGAAAEPRWIPGDMHAHVAPPDLASDVTLDVAGVAKLARKNGLEFVVLTPHLGRRGWRESDRRRRFLSAHATMAAQASATRGVTLIPGVEYGVARLGHFGVSGLDLARLEGEDFLAAARVAGAFIVVNHPFALPTRIPGVRVSHVDNSYRPWTDGHAGFADIDAVEVWNVPLSLANLVSRPGGRTGEDRALASADQQVRKLGRPIVLLGGSDNHSLHLVPTTWVLAADASEANIVAALRGGATCVGGPEAGTLRARGDLDPEGTWASIGGRVRAARQVELRFEGRARVFVDGRDHGMHDAPYRVDVGGGRHTFRITVGRSRSGFVYANL